MPHLGEENNRSILKDLNPKNLEWREILNGDESILKDSILPI